MCLYTTVILIIINANEMYPIVSIVNIRKIVPAFGFPPKKAFRCFEYTKTDLLIFNYI